MRILYCHGFASSFDPSTEKVTKLSALGQVRGFDIDYTQPAYQLIEHARALFDPAQVDVIVGTSMGGWLAAALGSRLALPFVAINPSIMPAQTLRKYIGTGMDYQQRPYTLTEAVVDTYPPIARKGRGLILLDEDDEVIDAQVTYNALSAHYPVHCFPGGHHRFAHMTEALPLIVDFLQGASAADAGLIKDKAT